MAIVRGGEDAQGQRDSKSGPLVTSRDDPSPYTNLCTASGLVEVGEDGRLRSYTRCPIWVGEKSRIAEARRQLVEPVERPTDSADDGTLMVGPEYAGEREMREFVG